MPAQHSTRSWPKFRGKEFRDYQRTPVKVQSKQVNSLPERPWVSLETYLSNGVFHDLLVLHIALVSNEQLVNTLGSVPINLLEPLLHVVEGIHVGDIVNHADSMSAPVVRRCDGTESLLAGGVPL